MGTETPGVRKRARNVRPFETGLAISVDASWSFIGDLDAGLLDPVLVFLPRASECGSAGKYTPNP